MLGRTFAANLVKNEELYKFVYELRERGLALAVLSDTIEPHARAIREAGLLEPFEHAFLSYEVGLRKPNLAIYRFVLEKLGLSPEQVGFTDDNVSNVEGAQSLGIRSVRFEGVPSLRQRILTNFLAIN